MKLVPRLRSTPDAEACHSKPACATSETFERLAWLEESGGLQDDEIWPLQLIDLRDHDQIEELYQLLKKTPPCIEYYLNEFIFPETAQHQNLKLSATGQRARR